MSKIINVAEIGGMVMERQEEAPDEPIRQFREAAQMLDGTGVDLVVTCETMMMHQPVGCEEDPLKPGPILTEYIEFAKRNNCTVGGAARIMLDGESRQSILYYGPGGKLLGMYHKVFPTDAAIRNGTIPGDGAQVVETPAGRLGGALCFDLNFDELRDEYILLKPDILCFSSYFHGDHLQSNWAYKTHSFLVGAIKDGTSDIRDPLGRVINSTTYYNRIAWARINLDRFVMHGSYNSEKFADIRRKYKEQILIDTHSPIGCSVLYSYSDEFTAEDVAREFELTEVEDFWKTCRELRTNALNKPKKAVDFFR
jgi:predicted amidohydrolase